MDGFFQAAAGSDSPGTGAALAGDSSPGLSEGTVLIGKKLRGTLSYS